MPKKREGEYKGDRLYRDFTHAGVKYILFQPIWIRIINAHHLLHASEWLLFLDIVMTYEREKQKPCEYSYDDLSDIYHYSKNTIRSAIDVLLGYDLIICLNKKTRKGKAKYQYVPNVERLHELFDRYRKKTALRKK